MSPGCMTVFGLPFLVAGLVMLGVGLNWWIVYFQSASWERVPATLLSIEWRTHHSSKGGTTYSVACVYRYLYQAREYTSSRVGVDSGSDSNHALHRHRYDLLVHHKEKEQSFTALVNPANPKQSVLFRDITSGMYVLPPFGTVFALVGGGMIVGGISNTRRNRRKRALLEQNPGRPWRAEEKWNDFSVSASARSELIILWAIGGFLGGFVSIITVTLVNDAYAPVFARIVIGFFGFIAAGLLGWAVYLTLRFLKYGNPRLAFAEIPLVPGNTMNALLMIKSHLVTEHGVDCTLKCLSKLTTGSGKSRHTDTTTLWEQTLNVQKDMAKSEVLGSAIPLQFQLPSDQPPRDPDSNPSIEWVLEAKASTPGVDFAVKLEDLPVYTLDDPSLIERRTGKTL
jgi:hypothetical protein